MSRWRARAGSDIAAESTDVFYNLGEGVSNAFIDGLKSQEAILAAQIASMVASIEAAFASMMDRLNNLASGKVDSFNIVPSFEAMDQAMALSGASSFTGEVRRFAQAGIAAGVINNYITVKAGVVTEGKTLGRDITAVVAKYTKANA